MVPYGAHGTGTGMLNLVLILIVILYNIPTHCIAAVFVFSFTLGFFTIAAVSSVLGPVVLLPVPLYLSSLASLGACLLSGLYITFGWWVGIGLFSKHDICELNQFYYIFGCYLSLFSELSGM